MKMLLRKELSENLRSCLVAGVMLGLGLAAAGRFVLDYGPPDGGAPESGMLWALCCLLVGASLGYWQLAHERHAGTEAYLHHRASGARGAFRAKVLVGLACLALVLALGMGLHAAWFALFAETAPLARWERVREHLTLATLLVSGYGAGLWTSSIPRAEGLRFMMLVLALASLFTLAGALSLRWDGGPAPPLARFALAQLALGAVLIIAAGRLQRATREPERPLVRPLALAQVPLALLLLGLPVALVPTAIQGRMHAELLGGHGQIVRSEAGELLVVEPLPGTRWPTARTYVPVDASGPPTPIGVERGWTIDPDAPIVPVYDPARTPLAWATAEPPPLRRRFSGRRFELDGPYVFVRDLGRGPRAAWLDLRRGLVLAVLADVGGRPLALRELGKGPAGARFSRDAVVVFGGRDMGSRSAVVVDRADRSAWELIDGPRGPELAPAPLPEGERLIDVERVHGRFRARVGLFEPYGVSDQLVARGEHGSWAWSQAGWTRFEPSARDVLESEFAAAVELRLELARADALAPGVVVRDAASGAVLIEHTFAPESSGQRMAAFAIQAASLLRPPLAALVAMRQDVPDRGRVARPLDPLVLDPALAGGRRPWLVLLALLVAGLFAWRAARHLGASDRSRRAAWLALVVLLGWPAFQALVLLEPSRRRAPARDPRRAPEPVLLVTTRAGG